MCIRDRYVVECSEENETKLRIQRNLNHQELVEFDFDQLFGFEPIEDVQLNEAKRLLVQNP